MEKHKKCFGSCMDVKKKSLFLLLVCVMIGIVLLVGAVFLFHGRASCLTMPATEMDIGGHEKLGMHIHQHLHVIIDGVEQEIPAGIGLSFEAMRPVHSHDATGKIHVEAHCDRDFTLGDFFDIWGEQFTSSCVLDSCIESGTLTMTVNGVPNAEFRNHILTDDDDIVITYARHS